MMKDNNTNIKDNIEAFVMTDGELQVLASMMGKKKLYGFGSDSTLKGELLKKNTYETIHSLAKKHYLEYVSKANKINYSNNKMDGKFDSLYINEDIVKIFCNIINAKEIIDITKWSTMENILIYLAEDIGVTESIGKKVTIIRPNIANKDELIVCAIRIEEIEEYLHDEGYLPQNALEGLFANDKAIGLDDEKYITFRIVDVKTLEEKRIINVYEDLSYDLDDNDRKVYSKNHIIKELQKK